MSERFPPAPMAYAWMQGYDRQLEPYHVPGRPVQIGTASAPRWWDAQANPSDTDDWRRQVAMTQLAIYDAALSSMPRARIGELRTQIERIRALSSSAPIGTLEALIITLGESMARARSSAGTSTSTSTPAPATMPQVQSPISMVVGTTRARAVTALLIGGIAVAAWIFWPSKR